MRSIVPDLRRLRWLAAALAASAAGACAATPAPDEARAFVAWLYAGYRTPDGLVPLGDKAPLVFTPRLVGLIRRDQADAHGEAGALDYDPICACQDFDISRVEVSLSDRTASTARARVSFDNAGEHQTLRLDLAHEADGWRVADVHDERVPSLIDYLERAHARLAARLGRR